MLMVINSLATYVSTNTKAAPLAVFRILFGLLMCLSIVRFWYNGWIEKLYLEPSFHFHYFGFEWVTVPGDFTYVLFFIAGLSALFITIGWYYRIAIVFFFMSFTYIELMDKTTYLNHYYFVSLLAFLLIFLPANRYFSVDAYKNPSIAKQLIPRYSIDAIKFLLAIVYISAGLAKLNYDWMFRAMPLTIWLPTKYNIPFLSAVMHEKWLHFAFSWIGALYDIFIVFFLLYRKTRIPAFILVIIFHVLTRMLFPIGMFPYIMIFSTLIFFSDSWHEKVLNRISQLLKIDITVEEERVSSSSSGLRPKAVMGLLSIFFIWQLLMPMRYLAKEGNVFWTEEGYRFSWRVMLMEKTGYANFKIVDQLSGKRFYVQNDDFLTPFQEKEMSTQVDFMIEYARFLAAHFEAQGHENLAVYVESYSALNGRPSQPYVREDVDLLTVKYTSSYNELIYPLND